MFIITNVEKEILINESVDYFKEDKGKVLFKILVNYLSNTTELSEILGELYEAVLLDEDEMKRYSKIIMTYLLKNKTKQQLIDVNRKVSSEKLSLIIDLIVTNTNTYKILLIDLEETCDDLFLLIIADIGIERNKRGRELRKCLRGIKVPIRLLVYTNEEVNEARNNKDSFLSEMIEKGQVLYEK